MNLTAAGRLAQPKRSACADAGARARAYVRGAIAAGADVVTGEGVGPLNHGFAPVPMHRLSAKPLR